MPRPDAPREQLDLQVALIRDLRRLIPVVASEEDAALPERWDADLPQKERIWWQEGWQATAAPAKEMTAKLIPIVTTAPTVDAVELAQTYIHRWPAQENVIKDYLRPLGLDTNHGFAKVAVENSEVAKRRTLLEQRLTRLKQWAQSAGKREAQASRRRERLRTTYKTQSRELYRELTSYQFTLEEQNLPEYVFRRKRQRNAKPRSTPNWNRSASKNGRRMSSVIRSFANRSATAKSNARCCVLWRISIHQNEPCMNWTIERMR